MSFSITSVKLGKQSFVNDYKSLSVELQQEASTRIAELLTNPKRKTLRLHCLSGYHPKVYTIDIESGRGKRHKATFILEGSIAVFQRIGTHKQIDRSPT